MEQIYNEKLEKYLANKEYNLIASLPKTIFDKTVIDKYGDRILKGINWNIPDNLRDNPYFFKICLDKKKYHLIGNFSNTLFTKEIISLYGDEILDNISKVPFNLRDNIYIFKKCIEQGKYNLLLTFSKNIYTEEVILVYGDLLLAVLTKLPSALKNNIYLFTKCLEKNRYDLLFDFSQTLFTEEIIKIYGEKILSNIKGIVPINLKGNEYLKNLCLNQNKLDLYLQFFVDENIINNEQALEQYSKLLEVDINTLREKLKYLYKVNDSIFETLNIEMLSRKMNKFAIEDIEKMALYEDVQNMILKNDDKILEILSKMFKCFNQQEYDICPLIYKVLVNIDNYKELMNNLDSNNLTEDMLKNLISILQFKDNYYNILTSNDLKEENFIKIREKKELKILENIKNDSIELEQLKNDVLIKKFGINIEMAKFICDRYCDDIESLNNSAIDIKTKRILESIYLIYNCSSRDKLKFFYLNSSNVRTDFASFGLLETKIRSKFAMSYTSTLYKVKEEHRVKKDINVSAKVFEMLSSVRYQGKRPDIYILDGDFNMQIHALGAYLAWMRPQNFKDRWENSKISYHGICTSYIGNNQIAIASNRHPAYGFSDYEPSALLVAGNNDIYSDDAIREYATSLYQPYNLYDPVTMINKTRFKYNEIVLERRDNNANNKFKRLPDYVVYFSDNLEEIDKHLNDECFEEAVQASIDMNIPMVIVDRLKYALSEEKKINDSISRFKSTLDIKDLRYIIINYCNNMVGNSINSDNLDDEYLTIFTMDKLVLIVADLYSFINTITEPTRYELLGVLKSLIEMERLDIKIDFHNVKNNDDNLFKDVKKKK